MAKWEAEFSESMNAQRDDLDTDYDYGASMQQAWQDLSSAEATEKPMEYDPQGIPLLGDYKFGWWFSFVCPQRVF